MRNKCAVEPDVVQLRKIYWIVGERGRMNHLLVDLQCICLLQCECPTLPCVYYLGFNIHAVLWLHNCLQISPKR